MSAEISKIDRDSAKLNPEAYFDHPQELIDEVGLTKGEKIATLERWAHSVSRRLDSGNEGMPTHGTEPRDSRLLRQLELVKHKLEKSVGRASATGGRESQS